MSDRDPSCHVVNGDCQAPPGLEGLQPRCRSWCFGCGLTVCKSCSRIRRWYRYGRRRICDHCSEQHPRA